MSRNVQPKRSVKPQRPAYVLEEQIGFILRQVWQRHATIFAREIGINLTPTQWAALAKLTETGPCSQNQLGRLTAMDVATIKGVIDRLTARGLTETSADLALMLAMVSSLRDRPLPKDLVVFGEVGLAGEIRPVPSGQERIAEAAKHGFRRAIVPFANVPKKPQDNMQIFGVKKLADALSILEELE